jgi:hypothetical protein
VKEAQAKLDEETAHAYVGQETQRIVRDYIARGGEPSESMAIKNLRSIEQSTDTALQKLSNVYKGKNSLTRRAVSRRTHKRRSIRSSRT